MNTGKHAYCQLAGQLQGRNPGHGDAAEQATRRVVWITVAMMLVELAVGWWSNSMALLADGWHMSSHVVAIGLSALAYAASRKFASDPRFAFGTWKIEILAGYTSAVFLLVIAALMVVGAVERLLAPEPVHFLEAMVVAAAGLAVNIVCALILGGAHDHGPGGHHHHDHGGGHGHDSHDHDLNLRSAYVHVLADAATSALAVAALAGGWLFNWTWLDPVTGIVGALVVAAWARNLLGATGKILLDREMDAPVVEEIREAVEAGSDGHATTLHDLHVWRVGPRAYACALALTAADRSLTADHIRERLMVHEEIVHSTIEIHYAPGAV
jgi:cation diffusion facilitator family transporter